MSRRRAKSGICLERTQDPGKDLFAYLFLMIMVFSIMLLMTTSQGPDSMSGQVGPQKQESTVRSSLAAVSEEKIGKLTKKAGQLYLVFGKKAYDPQKDLARLEKDGCIAIVPKGEKGGKRKLLYIEEDKINQVLLAEYLTAFQYLSRQGIDVAFAERVQ